MLFVMAAVEIPSYVFVTLSMDRVGRRFLSSSMMIVGGTALLVSAFFPSGKLILSINFCIISMLLKQFCNFRSIITVDIYWYCVPWKVLHSRSFCYYIQLYCRTFPHCSPKHRYWTWKHVRTFSRWFYSFSYPIGQLKYIF